MRIPDDHDEHGCRKHTDGNERRPEQHAQHGADEFYQNVDHQKAADGLHVFHGAFARIVLGDAPVNEYHHYRGRDHDDAVKALHDSAVEIGRNEAGRVREQRREEQEPYAKPHCAVLCHS